MGRGRERWGKGSVSSCRRRPSLSLLRSLHPCLASSNSVTPVFPPRSSRSLKMFLSRWFQRWRTPVAFPVETFRHILSYADTGTLAVCCRVNFTLLELASEILYDEVEVVGLERLRQLFNQVSSSRFFSSICHISSPGHLTSLSCAARSCLTIERSILPASQRLPLASTHPDLHLRRRLVQGPLDSQTPHASSRSKSPGGRDPHRPRPEL